MSFFNSLFLGIIQGITEFLPVSSSGHLNLFQQFFGLTPSLSFDIFLNTATLFSVLLFFRKDISFFKENLKYIIVASVPAAIIGIFFKPYIETIFATPNLLPYFFLLTSFILISTRFIKKSTDFKLSYFNSFLIGLAQALAILPAISRSGSTIVTALWLGLSSKDAFKFSFCLFIPASLGAILLDYQSLSSASLNFSTLFVFLMTITIGYLSLKLLRSVVDKKNLWYFGLYTLTLSLILIYLS